jgi:hypothetical protein
MTFIPLAVAQFASCKQAEDYPPPPVGQEYEGGGVGGGGGGGGSLPSSPCACPTAVDGGDTDAAPGTCHVDGFPATAASFALPAIVGALGSSGGSPFTSLAGSDNCSSGGTAGWTVIDMNGDERPDFVLTQACADAAIGASRWDVYFSTGTRFSANPTSFALPTISGALGSSGGPPLALLDGSDACSAGTTARWSVIDMNGDERPDLVLTQACNDSAVGASDWYVYFNTGTGFSANGTSFTLPTISGALGSSGGPPLTSLAGSDACSVGTTARWSVIDMNGDDKPDFVLTEACSNGTIGSSHWSVYFNTGTGFSANATSFTLPTVVAAVGSSGGPPLPSLDGSDACSLGTTARWSLIDMNGDERPDFVLTEACGNVSIGTSSWDVYLNTGAGFSTKATSFALPTVSGAVGPSGDPPLTSLDGSDKCSDGTTASWSLVDMNGDDKPDFLLTEACADSVVGTDRWDVYLNTGAGFSAKATSFTLPTISGALGSSGSPPLTSLDGSDECALCKTASWSVLYMNGDGEPDFLLTRACADSAIGSSDWSVYFARCGR